ncbi:hypothetical protein [Paraburkholderia sediminicola]|uniref:hypothetical protein n=1 Tax=Paraburkholderia sediminicola TaxID=458836 RepID=UPI0038B80940
MSKTDDTATALRAKVIQQGRFGRRCAYCDLAFGNSDDFELHNMDGDHTNLEIENLEPVCELCHAVFHLDLLSRKWPDDVGRIVFLPEISQAELNNLLQATFYAAALQMAAQTDGSATATPSPLPASIKPHVVYKALSDRALVLDGTRASDPVSLADPFVLARVMADMDDDTYAAREVLIGGARWLAPWDTFVGKAGGWARDGAAFSRLDMDAWISIADVRG